MLNSQLKPNKSVDSPNTENVDYKSLYARLQKIEPSLSDLPLAGDFKQDYEQTLRLVIKRQVEEMSRFSTFPVVDNVLTLPVLDILEQRSRQLDEMNIQQIKKYMNDKEYLNLRGQDLTRFPSRLFTDPETRGYFLGVKKINLKGNKLLSLPKEFNMCAALEKLDCSENKLTSLPDTLGSCPNLKKLMIVKNRLNLVNVGIISKMGWDWVLESLKAQREDAPKFGAPKVAPVVEHVPLVCAVPVLIFYRGEKPSDKKLSSMEYRQLLREAEVAKSTVKKGISP